MGAATVTGVGGSAGHGTRRVRDLLVTEIPGAGLLVTACDAAGAIGPKPLDVVRVPGRVAGLFTARVALMEVVAAGAAPLAVAAAVCCEPEPAGRDVVAGVLEEMAVVGLGPDALVVSTEKNFPTRQTGIGVTALGMAGPGSFLPGCARCGDVLILAGIPKAGDSVAEGDPEIVDLRTVARVIRAGLASDILPVGSRGAAAEAHELAASAGLAAVLQSCPAQAPGPLLLRSGGPATAVVIAVSPHAVRDLERIVRPVPCRLIGRLSSSASNPQCLSKG